MAEVYVLLAAFQHDSKYAAVDVSPKSDNYNNAAKFKFYVKSSTIIVVHQGR